MEFVKQTLALPVSSENIFVTLSHGFIQFLILNQTTNYMLDLITNTKHCTLYHGLAIYTEVRFVNVTPVAENPE